MKWPAIDRMKQWLLHENEEPTRAPRKNGPEIVVHYWDGSAPEGRFLRDISQTGAYIYTPERWYLGTIIRLILQSPSHKPAAAGPDGVIAPQASICIPAQVVRHGEDGVGVEFALQTKDEVEALRAFLATIPHQPEVAPPLPVLPPGVPVPRRGQALVEFALLIPLVLLLAVNAVNFGGFLFAWVTVAGAARAGAEYYVLSSASPGAATPATLAQVTALVTNDVTSLLNRASVVVAVCTNATTAANGCTTLFDPEAPTYSLATVDVTYTYVPFIPLFSFPGLGISATLPNGTIHRKAVMRMIQ